MINEEDDIDGRTEGVDDQTLFLGMEEEEEFLHFQFSIGSIEEAPTWAPTKGEDYERTLPEG